MTIKDKHEKLEQTKDEVIKLKESLDNGPVTPIIKGTVDRLENILNLLFDNDLYTPTNE
jgi:hypothetical protein